MESSQPKRKFSYTREQVVNVRDSELLKGSSDNFEIKQSIISKDQPARGRRKPIPLRTQDGQGDTPTTPSDSGSPALPVDTGENKDNWRRTVGAPVSCLPPGHAESNEYAAPLSTRHNSGSSGTEDTIVRPGGKEIDWTLGCGKWRHRSKSGSERGTRPVFGGTRGRGRGDMSDGIPFTGGRGRGFVRRPYQPHTLRGKGFKSHNGYHQPESPDDFWQGGDWKQQGAPGGPPFFAHHAQRPGDFDDMFSHPPPPFQRQPPAHEQGHTPVMSPPGISSDLAGQPPTTGVDPDTPKSPDSAPPSAPPGVRAPAVQTMWHYLDSEGRLQGPFDDATMASWFISGHLPITLQVRRQCDKVFLPLSDFLARLGRFPFVDSHKLPPILEPHVPPPNFPAVAVSPHSPQPPTPPPPPPPPQSQPLSPPPSAPPMPVSAPATPVLSPESPLATSASLQRAPPELEPKSPEATDRPVLTFGDVNFLAEATLSEVKRLQENAKILTERASALGADNSNLSKHLESLTLDASKVVPDSPTVTKTPEELSLSKEPSSEVKQVAAKMTEQPSQSIPETEPPAKQPVHLPIPGEASDTENVPPTPEATARPLESGANSAAAKKNKRNRKKAKQGEVSAEQTVDVVVAESDKAITPTEPPPPVPAPEEIVFEADWDTISDSMDKSAQPSTTEQESSSSKKSKKKRKSKPTAEELRQKAWAQEEERRRQAAAERLAAVDAEAARLAEERRLADIAYLTEAKKRDQAARQAELKAQKQREAEYRAAMSTMAGFSLPAAAKWASAGGKPLSNAPQPIPMTEILAEQTAEIMKANKGQAGAGTFAQKVAASPLAPGPFKGQAASKKKTQPSPQTVDAHPPAASNKSVAAASQPKMNARNDSQGSQKPTPQTPRTPNPQTVVSPKKSAVSIWDLPPDSSTVITTSKKTSKKKKNNANSQLLVGSAITLKPAARTELTHWCESQLSVFPRHNVDLPTLISLLCDIEEADDVLECIEASFGKSSRLSKFSKAFVEKRATLMRSTA